MNAEKIERNWQLVTAGVLLVVFGLVCAFFPGLTLASIALMVGAAFAVSGAVNVVTYVSSRDALSLSAWVLAYGVIDFLIGAMFIVHPFALATVVPWLVAFFVVLFAVYEICESFVARRAGFPLWGWLLTSGILSVALGIALFMWPELLALYIALFALLRGASLIILGLNSRKFV